MAGEQGQGMAVTKTVAVVVGSVRKGSINQALARALERLAEGRMAFDFLPTGELPLYNGDLEIDPPAVLWDFKRRIEAADGVLFVTPEHNRSVSAMTKNAIDWGSRPAGSNSWAGKKAAVCGASPGTRGADLAQMHLRQIVVPLDIRMMAQPEAYTRVLEGTITDDHAFTDERDRQRFERFLDAFAAWIS